MRPSVSDTTILLADAAGRGAGSRAAADRLMALVYAQLRAAAGARMAREDPANTLQPTDLVHEAYLRMIDQETGWKNRSHFLGIAGEMMRRVLVDHARAKQTLRRGGDGRKDAGNPASKEESARAAAPPAAACRVTFDQTVDEVEAAGARVGSLAGVDVLDLDDALVKLGKEDPELERVAVLRFFAGLSVEQAAECMGVSERTVEKKWSVARTLLWEELVGEKTGGAAGTAIGGSSGEVEAKPGVRPSTGAPPRKP